MSCPTCDGVCVLPDDGSSIVVAWYTCPGCGHIWSARLRNGQPDPTYVIDISSLEPPTGR